MKLLMLIILSIFEVFFCQIRPALAQQNMSRRFYRCDFDQKKALEALEGDVRTLARSLTEEIESALSNPERFKRDFRNDRELRRASRLLSCALKHVGALDYTCKGIKYYDAQVNWIFARVIRVSQGFWSRSEQGRVAAILHEYTHKCGTTDAAYFRAGSPRSTRMVPWSLIADTYEYWGAVGFCVPGETCE